MMRATEVFIIPPGCGIAAVACGREGEGLAEQDLVAFVVGGMEAVDTKDTRLLFRTSPILIISFCDALTSSHTHLQVYVLSNRSRTFPQVLPFFTTLKGAFPALILLVSARSCASARLQDFSFPFSSWTNQSLKLVSWGACSPSSPKRAAHSGRCHMVWNISRRIVARAVSEKRLER